MQSILLALALSTVPAPPQPADQARWKQHAAAVTITRDDWGIPHVKGKTDADAVFGLIYAQAEDDFNRIEMNYLNAMGRVAEAEGEGAIYRDLRMRLIADPDSMKAQYARTPVWLRRLMDAWADGLNYYLSTHPAVKPKVLTRFEPWMVMSFTEGSIGWDIERVPLEQLAAFYDKKPAKSGPAPAPADQEGPEEPRGSNGIAIAPSRTASGAAMLLINPHTSFFFREEAQVQSDEGLNAYGAITWGQFFVYQGFNEKSGWMHTSSGADAVDEYAETVTESAKGVTYRYGAGSRPMLAHRVTIAFKTAAGMARKEFTTYRSHHGPIVRQAAGKWIAFRLMDEPIKALTQSYARIKTTGYDSFRKNMELHTNSSNNTLFADAAGNIAYFHANFVPKRDVKFDWTKPVDGSNPATEWKGIHSIEESPNVKNPATGWVFNTNDWPYSAAGPDSPKAKDYPAYFDQAGENPRGIHAQRALGNRTHFTLDTLIAVAFDRDLPAFDDLIPALVDSWDKAAASDPLKSKLADQVAALRAWDRRWGAGSVPTSLAVYWAQELWRITLADAESEQMSVYAYMAKRTTAAQRLQALATASDRLAADFGSWKTPWGEINRFQRLTGDIVQPFSDAGASTPVPFASAQWGSLASFGARTYPGTKRMYGTSGNSFVAVVEFGKTVRAKAVTAGGLNGDPKSAHFNDQAERYAGGRLRDVYFYPGDLEGHVARKYHPGG